MFRLRVGSQQQSCPLDGRGGNQAAARGQLAALVPVFERVLGPEHPETLTIRYNLAVYTGSAGAPAQARDQFAALAPVAKRVLGAKHPITRNARMADRGARFFGNGS